MEFTFGTDAEFFLHDGTRYVSAIPYIGDSTHGTKHNPIKLPHGSTVQRDNVAVEFATPPVSSFPELQSAIRWALKDVYAMLPKGMELHSIASVQFDANQLDHPEAMEFGCDPDFNAWKNGKVNEKPWCGDGSLRSAAAHIHVGHSSLSQMRSKINFIKLMDFKLGVTSIMLDTAPESARRKLLYGKAGAFRPTSYGAEYRTLSNFWISCPIYAELFYKLTHAVLNDFTFYWMPTPRFRLPSGKDIITTINNNNIRTAIYLAPRPCDFTTDVGWNDFTKALKYKPKSLRKEWKV